MTKLPSIITKSVSIFLVVALLSQSSIAFVPKRAEAFNLSGLISGAVSLTGLAGTALSCIFPEGLNTTLTSLVNSIFKPEEILTDSDNDTILDEAEESIFGTDPFQMDTDGGGLPDPAEIMAGSDPLNPGDDIPINPDAGALIVVDYGTISAIGDLSKGVNNNIKKTNQELTKIRKEEEKDTHKEKCSDAIAHFIVMKVIDKITLATVDWINSGFAGDPFYVEDTFGFLNNIATEEINNVTGWFTASPEGYPFGDIVMMSILGTLQQEFTENMQFSLNQVLAHGDYSEFRVNFNIGGWAGYNAFLQPNNNPFGNYLLVNEELGRRIGGTSINIAENFSRQLNQSGGFLSQRKCVMSGTGLDDHIPADSDPDANPPYLNPNTYQLIPSGGTMTGAIYTSLPADFQAGLDILGGTDEQAEVYNNTVLRSTCKKWEVITPGSVVANQLTTNINLNNSKLVSADELNENLGLIFDALLLQLVNTGIRSFQGASNGGSSDNNVLLAQVEGLNPGDPGVTGDGFVPAPPPLDIIQGTGEVDTTIFDVQSQYINTANGQALPLADELIRKIRALDFCVPGPNPRWYSNGLISLQQALQGIPTPPNGSSSQEQQDYYAMQINTLTGINISPSNDMTNMGQFNSFMQNVFNKYAEKMLATYPLTSAPPTTRSVLNSLFNDMDTYSSDISIMNDIVSDINEVLPTLQAVQDALAVIEANTGTLDPANPDVQAQLSIFDSISDQLASQDEYDTLVSRIGEYQTANLVISSHLNSCIQETVVNAGSYSAPNQNQTYPFAYFDTYTQTVPPGFGLPGPDTSFLPGVIFDDVVGGNSINIQFGNIDIDSTSGDLTDFEGVLQTIY
jgi:hypothetical protein